MIARNMLPLVHEGDPIFHIATFEESAEVEKSLASLVDVWDA
ncbi:MAG TPA: hypothetical protein VE954_10075 [Oligoflexus sp.]|nr:hypothetical protein [Oligoflexus sp.]HYX33449.1 hypothetical protein [Oligoflexus sp.]